MVPKIKIIRTPDGLDFPLPSYSSKHHFGLNLLAGIPSVIKLNPGDRVLVPVGFAIALSDGLCGQIVSLPDLAHQHGVIVLDSPSIINPANHEPLFVLLQNTGQHQYVLKRGTPIAWMIITPVLQVCWEELKADMSKAKRTQPIIEESVLENEDEHLPFHSKRKEKPIRNRFKQKDEDE